MSFELFSERNLYFRLHRIKKKPKKFSPNDEKKYSNATDDKFKCILWCCHKWGVFSSWASLSGSQRPRPWHLIRTYYSLYSVECRVHETKDDVRIRRMEKRELKTNMAVRVFCWKIIAGLNNHRRCSTHTSKKYTQNLSCFRIHHTVKEKVSV